MDLGKVWQNLYVCGIGLFSYLSYVYFWKFHAGRYIDDFVNKTSLDKGGACANEKLKRCNGISSDITLGWNYPSVGYLLSKSELTQHYFRQTNIHVDFNLWQAKRPNLRLSSRPRPEQNYVELLVSQIYGWSRSTCICKCTHNNNKTCGLA